MKRLLLLLTICLFTSVITPVNAATYPADVSVPSEGNVFLSFEGTYYKESKTKILNRINAIRKEACDNGYINPNTGKKLTPDDYVPMKWSSELETIARLRCAEATLVTDHIRPNGTVCFSAVVNEKESWAENLAWNYDGMMMGIEQWYSEKNAWVNQNKNAVTGHYTSLINPSYQYFGLGAFRLSQGGWISIAGEFSFEAGSSEEQSNISGKHNQIIEVPQKQVTYSISADSAYNKNATAKLTLKANYNGYNAKVVSDVIWSSSDTSVATIDQTGKLVTKDKDGKTTISATVDGKTIKKTIEVNMKIKTVKLNKTSATLKRGKTLQLKATINPTNTTSSKTLTWKTSNKNVATVTSKGVVTAKKPGTATITVTTSNGKKATCKINVPYKVTYKLNGGKNNKNNTATYKYGDYLLLSNPTRKGYAFKGWYYDYKMKYQKTDFLAGGDRTIYAKWEKVTVATAKTLLLQMSKVIN